MKRIYYLFAAAVFIAGCNTKLPKIAFSGNVTGAKDAVIIVTDADGNNIAGQNITNGSFKMDTVFENPGYGKVSIKQTGSDDYPMEVYLEAGHYTLEADAAHLDRYPKITSSSAIQNELTAFYTIQDELSLKAHHKVVGKLEPGETDIDRLKLKAFRQFINKHPNSTAATHIMLGLQYERDVQPYYEIYNKLSQAAKSSEEGKFVGKKLAGMMKLLPGAKAPDIAGTTPDGAKFDKTKLDKKVYVLEVWKAGNQISRMNHKDIIDGMLKNLDNKKAGFIGISLDSKRDWWTKAIADDKVTWPQYADLKGDESANAQQWAINKIPTYYVLNGKWEIIERDASFSRLEFIVRDYLAHH
ncbi:hypothetical protein [Mucilaginibacter sp. PAMB04168]|uniref:TlpA family protein disulfide reductase n=1 Tax=Mucilaginibacter sp. PAMB04168 TaxID=3138567 RepID=UPI0031F71EAA